MGRTCIFMAFDPCAAGGPTSLETNSISGAQDDSRVGRSTRAEDHSRLANGGDVGVARCLDSVR